MPQAKLSSMDWIKYWDKDTLWAESAIWTVNAEIFMKKSAPILKVSADDCVLDIGCGPGAVAGLLAPKVAAYTGTDTSPALLRLAGKRCAKYPNAVFTLASAGNFAFEKSGTFSLILCVSVVQYFQDLSSVLDLVLAISKVASPGARFLIADIPQPRNFKERVGDSLASLSQSIREKYFLSYLKMVREWFFSDYRKFSQNNDVLELPIAVLKEKVEAMGFKATVIHESVSICANRPSLLVEF